jgi:hypothetical protein
VQVTSYAQAVALTRSGAWQQWLDAAEWHSLQPHLVSACTWAAFLAPPPVSFLGDTESSLGDAESSLGDAKSSLGDAKSSLGDAESSLGDAKSSLGDAKRLLGDAESLCRPLRHPRWHPRPRRFHPALRLLRHRLEHPPGRLELPLKVCRGEGEHWTGDRQESTFTGLNHGEKTPTTTGFPSVSGLPRVGLLGRFVWYRTGAAPKSRLVYGEIREYGRFPPSIAGYALRQCTCNSGAQRRALQLGLGLAGHGPEVEVEDVVADENVRV